MDITKSFILIIMGTYAYSYFLSGIWIKNIKRLLGKSSTAAV